MIESRFPLLTAHQTIGRIAVGLGAGRDTNIERLSTKGTRGMRRIGETIREIGGITEIRYTTSTEDTITIDIESNDLTMFSKVNDTSMKMRYPDLRTDQKNHTQNKVKQN